MNKTYTYRNDIRRSKLGWKQVIQLQKIWKASEKLNQQFFNAKKSFLEPVW